jgi:EmrB/QacA subfamily drug resistance transporter
MPKQLSKPQVNGWIVLTVTILGSSMAFLDGTVVNVSLPALQAAFRAPVSAVQWVVEAYALALAALLLLGGSLGDLYGRRKIFTLGVCIFTGASAVCGLCQTIDTLVAARSVQGVGAALLIPGSLALISSFFPQETRGKAIGTWSGFTALTAALGPIVGGWLIEHSTWRWVFFLNLPLAAFILLLCAKLPESRSDSAKRLDWLGALLATSALFGLTYALIEWPYHQHSPLTTISACFGAVSLIAFVATELRSSAPMLPLRLFAVWNFSLVNLLTFLLYAALGGVMFFFPMNLIQIWHYTPTQAGAAFFPFIGIMFAFSRSAGNLPVRFGPRVPLSIGPIITACGYGLLASAQHNGSYWQAFFPAVVVLGIGMTISVAPLTTTVMNAVSDDESGIASGINNAVSRLAALLAIALFGLLLIKAYNRSLDDHLARLHLTDNARNRVEAVRSELAAAHDADPRVQTAIVESFSDGYRLVIWVAAGLAFTGGMCSLLFDRARHDRGGSPLCRGGRAQPHQGCPIVV